MRRDIQIHIQTGDIAIATKNKHNFREFRWVDNSSGLTRYLYGEVDVPHEISERSIATDGVYTLIPYTPIYKEFMVRIRRVKEDGSFTYLTNETNGSQWFLVKHAQNNAWVSTLPSISEIGFYLQISNGVMQIFSSGQSDFNIVNAARQNANCLLACFPGSNYRYPLTGVGLARWINSNNIEAIALTQVLQKEFNDDGVMIRNAAYNYDTHQMELDANDLEV